MGLEIKSVSGRALPESLACNSPASGKFYSQHPESRIPAKCRKTNGLIFSTRNTFATSSIQPQASSAQKSLAASRLEANPHILELEFAVTYSNKGQLAISNRHTFMVFRMEMDVEQLSGEGGHTGAHANRAQHQVGQRAN